MTVQRILYLNTHRLSAYAWDSGHVALEEVFEATPEDQGRFTAYLRRHSHRPLRLLCNVAEESHQVETIPFLRGADRELLLERKASQLFFGTALTASTSLGYEKDRRKNERVLVSALTNPLHLQPWLNGIAEAEVPLAGVYTISQLGGRLLRRIAQVPPRCLLLTLQDHSIRESYLADGVPVFSRMAPLFDGSLAGIATTFATEGAKLHQYLVSQRQIGRNDRLPVFVVIHPEAVEVVRSVCSAPGATDYQIVDSGQAAARLGLRNPPADAHCENLFVHLLATSPPREQFVAEENRRDFRLYQLRRGLVGAGVLALLAALLFAGKQLAETHLNRSEGADLIAAEHDMDRRYRQITAAFPQLGVSNDTLRRVVGRYQEWRRVQRQPGDTYRHIGRAMDQSPAIELEAIEWRLGADGGPGGNSPSNRSPLLQAGEEIAVVKGVVRVAPDAQPRQVLAAFEQFVSLLQSGPEIRVTVLQRPFDIESGRTLKGGDREDQSAQPRSFAVQLARKLPA